MNTAPVSGGKTDTEQVNPNCDKCYGGMGFSERVLLWKGITWSGKTGFHLEMTLGLLRSELDKKWDRERAHLRWKRMERPAGTEGAG